MKLKTSRKCLEDVKISGIVRGGGESWANSGNPAQFDLSIRTPLQLLFQIIWLLHAKVEPWELGPSHQAISFHLPLLLRVSFPKLSRQSWVMQ